MTFQVFWLIFYFHPCALNVPSPITTSEIWRVLAEMLEWNVATRTLNSSLPQRKLAWKLPPLVTSYDKQLFFGKAWTSYSNNWTLLKKEIGPKLIDGMQHFFHQRSHQDFDGGPCALHPQLTELDEVARGCYIQLIHYLCLLVITPTGNENGYLRKCS